MSRNVLMTIGLSILVGTGLGTTLGGLRTPAMTPTLRSIARVRDWLRLGCTTSSAAMAAKTGGVPGKRMPAMSQAVPVATADLTTCRRGARRGARIVADMLECAGPRAHPVQSATHGGDPQAAIACARDVLHEVVGQGIGSRRIVVVVRDHSAFRIQMHEPAAFEYTHPQTAVGIAPDGQCLA